MAFLPPAVFEIKAVADQAIAKFKDVNKELEKMEGASKDAGGSVSGIDKASRNATAGLLAMGAAFVGFAAIGIKEANDSEQALNKLGVTLSNFGINTAATREQLEKLTNSYEDLGFGNEEAAAGFDKLLTATGDVTTATNYLSLAADFARKKNISLEEASSSLARASAGNAKAFKELGITLDTTLPKSEAVKKAMGELNDKIGGQAVAYTKTFAGQLAVVKEQVLGLAESVGATLMPYIKGFIGLVKTSIEFMKQHKTLFGGIATAVIGLTIALASYNATVKITTAFTKAWAAISAIAGVVQKGLTTGQWQLNGAMNANPIGLIVAGLALLATAFVLAWNNIKPFRVAMVDLFQLVINGVGYLVGAIGKLLSIASKIPGVGGKFKGAADFVNGLADDVRKFSNGLDKLNDKKITIGFSSGVKIPGAEGGGSGNGKAGGGKGSGAGSAELKKANDGYMKIVKDLQEKVSSAKSKFNEKMLEADKNYNEDVAKITAEYSERKAEIEAQYAETKLKLETKKGEDLAKAAEDNQKRVIEITKAGQEKLQQIVQQSIDRLRDAFRKGTEFNVSDIFTGLAEAGTQSADGLIAALKSRLTAAKDLAANAAKLQAQGFSQTFIEQVVAAGPEVGNQLSASILNARPETIAELKATYGDLEKLTNTGLDRVAEAMNNGGQLATAELNQAYQQAKIDTQNMLTEQTKAYADAQAAITKQFDKDMAEAATTRDKALIDAKTAMDKAIAEANKALADAQAAARKQLTDDLTAINKEFTDKLAGVRDANQKTIDSINALKAAMASAASLSMSASYGTPVSDFTPYITNSSSAAGSQGFIGPVAINNNTTVVAQTNASPVAIAKTATASAKLAATVTVSSYSGGYQTGSGVSSAKLAQLQRLL